MARFLRIPRARWVFWTVILGVGLALAGMRLAADREYADIRRKYEGYNEAQDRLWDATRDLRGQSQAVLRKELAGIARVMDTPGGTYLIDVQTGISVRAYFSAGGFSLLGHSSPLHFEKPWHAAFCNFRVSIAIIAFVAWLGALIAVFAYWRRHRAAGEALLGFGLLFVLAYLLTDKQPPIWAVNVPLPWFRDFDTHWLWLLVAPPLLAILIILLPNRRPRPQDAPMCHKCGYNLTGNVSGICPECGTPIREFVHRAEAERLQTIVADLPEEAPADAPEEV